MNTKLRLLIDESVEDPVADVVSRMSAFNAMCVRDLPSLKGGSDRAVMDYAQKDDRIVLTIDAHFNKTNYPICRHEGIIRISARCRTGSMVADSIRKFAQCGHRSEAKHSITLINQDSCTIETIAEVTTHRFPG